MPEGSTTIITGPTGSGKSTLLSLLMRFDDPDNRRSNSAGSTSPGHAIRRSRETDRLCAAGSRRVRRNAGRQHPSRRPSATDEGNLMPPMRQNKPHSVVDGRSPLDSAMDRPPRKRTVRRSTSTSRDRPSPPQAGTILILDEATSALDTATEAKIAKAIRALPVHEDRRHSPRCRDNLAADDSHSTRRVRWHNQ